MINEISKTAGVSAAQANKVVEEFLLRIHKMEYEKGEQYGLVESIRWQVSERSLYHLLGFIESWSEANSWENGYMNEYLGRMPLVGTWEEIGQETEGWKRYER